MTHAQLLKAGVKIERLQVESRRAPAYEAYAPDGWHFASGRHSITAFDRKDLMGDLDGEQLERCPIDCECGEGE